MEGVMPVDPRKRQKKLERRTAKRKEKRQFIARRENLGVGHQLTAASRCPVLHCWVADSLQEEGIGSVVLSRELSGGRVAVASFLVDAYCLGVKDAFAVVM